MSQMEPEYRDFGGVEFVIEQDGAQVWLRWPGDDQSILLGRVEVVAHQFRKWLETGPVAR